MYSTGGGRFAVDNFHITGVLKSLTEKQVRIQTSTWAQLSNFSFCCALAIHLQLYCEPTNISLKFLCQTNFRCNLLRYFLCAEFFLQFR